VPLFVSAFQKSEELADAMEARGYNPGAKRTRYRKLDFAIRDLVGASCLCFNCLFEYLFQLSSRDCEDFRNMEELRKVKCVISYDGSSFNGFQSQKDVRNIQDEIELALTTIHKEEQRLVASGRTDRGGPCLWTGY
jgi:hypothetical protein